MIRVALAVVCAVIAWSCLLLTALLLVTALTGCTVTSDGHGRVAVGQCDIIVDDTLGHMPPTHGGPEPSADRGNGLECYWRF